VLKKMEGHRNPVWRLAVSRDGQLIASGDENGEIGPSNRWIFLPMEQCWPLVHIWNK
ncbi:hypothetical protein C8R48DRAFT_719043, partial [Suillus tomentosus]